MDHRFRKCLSFMCIGFLALILLTIGGGKLLARVIYIDEIDVYWASIYDAITSPEKLAGKKVWIYGFLVPEGPMFLYPSEVDAKMRNVPVGIRVSSPSRHLADSECLNQYVKVTGTFEYSEELDEWGITDFSSISRFTFDEYGNTSRCKVESIR